MNKSPWILLVLLLICPILLPAQTFNPEKVKHSLVKVIVSVNSRESNSLTGFLWKSPEQIVTSLHGMNPTGEIRVLYQGQAWRKARIKKVLQKADLVLLELLPGQPALPLGVIPISSFNPEKIAIGTDVFALGYNGGATGSSTRQMKKGYVDPETLANLIPKKDKGCFGPELDSRPLILNIL